MRRYPPQFHSPGAYVCPGVSARVSGAAPGHGVATRVDGVERAAC